MSKTGMKIEAEDKEFILGHQLARELSAEELQSVSAGMRKVSTCTGTDGGCCPCDDTVEV